jgi:anti-anti-sigma factor
MGPGARVSTLSRPVPHPSTLRVNAEVEPPNLLVRLEGEIDFGCCDLLQAFTEVELAGVTTVVVDLSALEFTDVAGMRALMRFRSDKLGAQRAIQLVAARPPVRRVFSLCGEEASLAA